MSDICLENKVIFFYNLIDTILVICYQLQTIPLSPLGRIIELQTQSLSEEGCVREMNRSPFILTWMEVS